jgi:hypothetical protein
VYVGEGQWGCTADDEFFKLLDASWEQEKFIDIPQWDGMHDGMNIYRRLSSAPPQAIQPKSKTGRGRRRDTVGASSLWPIVEKVQFGSHINWAYSQNVLDEIDCNMAHRMYAKAVEFAMSHELPLSSIRVIVSALRHEKGRPPRDVTFLTFNGREWSAEIRNSLVANAAVPANRKWGVAFLEIAAEDLDSQQKKRLHAQKLRGEDFYHIRVTGF